MKKTISKIFKKQKGIFLLLLLCMSTGAYAQSTITGKITAAADGLPIPGANVIIKGTTSGTATDFDGNYQINVSSGDVLTYSYLGYKTIERIIGNETIINISLEEDSSQLDEVVVVGYGTQKRATLTGAVSTISTDNLESRAVTNISSSLSGLAPGVLVTQANGGAAGADGATIRIRGTGTFNDSNPLIVVDGVPSGSTSIMNDIDPNDIENISVLKDASAAIYGSRGANGVILITTKRGKSGKSSFDYNAYTGFQKVLKNPEFVSDFATYMELANVNRGEEIFTQSDIQEWRDNPNDPLLHPNVDWYEEQIGNTAFMQSHNLSFSGGTDKSIYRFSLSYLDQEGIIPGNEFKRYGARMNLQTEVLDGLKIGSNLFFRWSDLDDRGRDQRNSAGNIVRIYDANLGMVPAIPNIQHPDGRWGGAQQGAVGTISNPYATLANESDKRRQQRFQGDVFAAYEVIDGLTATVKLALNFNNEQINIFKGRYDIWNFRDNVINREFGLQSNRSFESRNNEDYLLTTNFLLEYKKTFGKHDFGVLGGYESVQVREDNVKAAITNIPSDELRSIDAGLENPSVAGNTRKSGLLSYFGKANYSFDNKYLLDATFRADASSRFREGKKWGYFPAFSAGWVVSRENFMEQVKFIDFLKFRGSWGKLGNNRIPFYPYQEVYNLNQNYTFGGNVVSGIAQNRLVDGDIQWEVTTNVNVGFDATFFNGSLNATFDYYKRTTDDILADFPIPTLLGDKDEPVVNLAQMINKGFEISLGYRGNIGDFNYRISGNLTQNDNEVTGFFEDIQTGGTQIGLPYNSFWGLESVGIFKTQQQLDDAATHRNDTDLGDIEFKDQLTVDTDGDGIFDEADGVIDNNDRTFIGSRIPKYVYGGSLGFDYKGFDFGVIIQGVAERSVNTLASGTIPIENSDRGMLHQRWVDDAWSSENINGSLPRLNESAFGGLNNDLSDFWVKDVSFLRVKNIQLGYSLPSATIEKWGVRKLRLYVSADNVFTSTNEEWGFDPETANNDGRIPNVGTFIMGLNLGF